MLQFHLDISHIVPGLLKEETHRGFRDLFSFFFHAGEDPAHKAPLVLAAKFYNAAHTFHSLIELAPLVHFLFHEDHTGGVRHGLYVVRQLGAGVFEKAGIFQKDQPLICKEGHGLRLVDDCLRVHIFSRIDGKIHRVALGKHGLRQLFLIELAEIGLLPAEKIYFLKLFFPNVLY